ncbi:MAG: 4'-phosphopantetheinyl transferase superfamily protein [Bacteroidia bacterium]|nr:4'-phosphopantetheinyl transferase superfamily protein [Bacteroidia bacterium]
MTLAKKIETDAGQLGIWLLNEPLEQLLQNFHFTETEKKEFDCITSEKRKKEYLAVRTLLENLLNFKPQIDYEKSGKPILANSPLHISVSHSADLVVAVISKINIGIDVERIDRDINRIATRFLHPQEMNFVEQTQNQQSAKVLLWSAKEAIFKCTCLEGIEFSRQIRIQPFILENTGKISGELNANSETTKYQLEYFFFENNVIVFCVEIKI